jgi:hypothetical protein
MQEPRTSENVVTGFGAGVTALIVPYAVGVDLFHLDRTGVRNIFLASFVIGCLVLIARVIRLRRHGVAIFVKSVGPVRQSDYNAILFWVVCLALVGAYSCRELLIGSFAVGIIGVIASLSSMYVLTVALVRWPAGPGAAA